MSNFLLLDENVITKKHSENSFWIHFKELFILLHDDEHSEVSSTERPSTVNRMIGFCFFSQNVKAHRSEWRNCILRGRLWTVRFPDPDKVLQKLHHLSMYSWVIRCSEARLEGHRGQIWAEEAARRLYFLLVTSPPSTDSKLTPAHVSTVMH